MKRISLLVVLIFILILGACSSSNDQEDLVPVNSSIN